MAYRNRTFVSFDGDNDIQYYRLMCAWKRNDNIPFGDNFQDAHDLNYARDTSTEESIKAQLRIRFDNSKNFILLVGNNTRYLRKFVPWEIEQALRLDLPRIVVNLNGLRQMDGNLCPPTIRDELAVHVSFNAAIIQYALDNWPATFESLRSQGKTGAFFYKEASYRELGL